MPKSARSVAAWGGRLFLMEGRALYVGPATAAAAHAHHAVQLTVALSGRFRCVVGAEPSQPVDAVLVAADVVHAIDPGDSPLAMLYLDPEASPVRGLLATLAGASHRKLSPEILEPDLRVRLQRMAAEGGSIADAVDLADELHGTVIPGQDEARRLDRRVQRVVTIMRERSDGDHDLSDLARMVQLSADRLGHLFSQQVGLPFRRYSLWMRLQHVLRALGQGASLTEAAHRTGFADSAHLSRTFRRMFGISPSLFASHAEVKTD